jgi:iron complex transport system substrate-binding protein
VEVFAVNPTSMSDIIRNIFAIGTVTNREHSAYSLTQKMKRGIAWVEARAKSERKYRRYKALIVVSRHPLLVAGDDTYYSDMLRISGLINVAPKGQKGYVKMSRKDVEKADPDIIIASTDYAREPKDVYGNWDFCNTSAGKNKKALVIDRSVFYRPGPRVVTMLQDIAGFAYEWRNNEEAQ